jgi:dTDP-4-amino-4,6-dideoxygalactose transaminase
MTRSGDRQVGGDVRAESGRRIALDGATWGTGPALATAGPQDLQVPFHRPTSTPRAIELVAEAARSRHPGGDGPFGRQVEAVLSTVVGERTLLTTSCTHALEVAAILLGLGPGDEVVVPGFTFVSTALAFTMRGATPVFVDVRPDTLNLDERQLEAAITPRTRAVVPVHYGGIACDMDAIGSIAARHGVAVVEDAAHGLLGAHRGRPLGSIGDLGAFSFHETKNFSAGEGGALVVRDPELAARAEIIREKGTNRSRFFRGEVDKYTWVDLGSSYVMADVLAAMLLGQLEERDAVQAARRATWERYDSALRGWAAEHGVATPVVPVGCDPAWHLYHLVLPTDDARDRCISHLRERGVKATFHYLPLHLSEMGLRFGGRAGQLPVTEAVSDRLVRLPLYTDLTPDEREQVVDAVLAFRP